MNLWVVKLVNTSLLLKLDFGLLINCGKTEYKVLSFPQQIKNF